MLVRRAHGDFEEARVEALAEDALGREWEWEETPEVSLVIADDLDHAIALFNRYSPQFCASLISEDLAAQARFFDGVNAPFVGDGFTRWVDGQYALLQPELGLSNWENGRLLARGGGADGGGGVYGAMPRGAGGCGAAEIGPQENALRNSKASWGSSACPPKPPVDY